MIFSIVGFWPQFELIFGQNISPVESKFDIQKFYSNFSPRSTNDSFCFVWRAVEAVAEFELHSTQAYDRFL